MRILDRIGDLTATIVLTYFFALSLAPVDGFAQEEPFAGASPSFDTPPEDRAEYNAGAWGVAEEQGAAIYTVPIEVPPGRNGMAPSLVLRYSSRSPLRGTLAAGWTLDLPSIEIDRSPGYEDGQTFYKASLRGASGPLVEVPDTSPYDGAKAYRVRFDNSFTRLFRHTQNRREGWTALSPDGVRHHFEVERGASDLVSIWNITRQVDSFGNTVRYHWQNVHAPDNERVVIDHSLRRIEYTANESAGLDPHVKIEFKYGKDACAGSTEPIVLVGAAYEPGNKAPGTQRLDTIKVSVRDTPEESWRLSKKLVFSYTLRSSRLFNAELVAAPPNGSSPVNCDQLPVRHLTRIDRTDYGPDKNETFLPPLTFEYNFRKQGPYVQQDLTPLPHFPGATLDPARTIDSPGYGHHGNHKGAKGTLLDLNGDGILDRANVVEEDRICTLVWQKGEFGGGFESNVSKSPLPTAPWYRETLDPPQPEGALLPQEGCNLNGQVAYRPRPVAGAQEPQAEKGRLAYRFVDYTGDGHVDLLTTVWAPFAHNGYVPDVTISEGPVAVSAPAPPNNQPPESGSDFLPMKPESQGQNYIWRVYRNASDPESVNPVDEANVFSKAFFQVTSPVALPPTVSDEKLDDSVLPNSILPPLVDLDGDGFLDVVDIGSHPNLTGWSTEGCDAIEGDSPSWCVYFGNGGSEFSPGYEWPLRQITLSQVNPSDVTGADGWKHIRKHTAAMLRDINGDGRSDLIVREEDNRLRAYLNYGEGFSITPVDLERSGPIELLQTDHSPFPGAVMDGHRGSRRRLIDLDGDGLQDMIFYLDDDADDRNNIHHEHKVKAAFNTGAGFLSAVDLPMEWQVAKRLFTAADGDWRVETDFTDLTGDGLSDMVTWTDTNTLEVVERPGLPPAPDRLAAVENGRGKRIEFTYASTGNSAPLPSHTWVVTETRVTGNHDTPEMVRHYRYADPAFISTGETSSYPEVARFLGFRRTSTTTLDASDSPARKVAKRFLYGEPDHIISPSGALAEQWTYRVENGQFQLHRYLKNDWQREPLFDGLAYFVHRTSGLTRTCLPDSTEGQCMDQTENVHRREEIWVPVDADQNHSEIDSGGDGPAILYVRTQTQRGSGLSANESDRRTNSSYTICYGQQPCPSDEYRIQTLQTVDKEARANENGLTFEIHGQTETVYDPTIRLPIEIKRWQGEASPPAITKRTFDSQTGNLLSRTKPKQASAGGSGAGTTFEYDEHELFVATTTNELNQITETDYDLATGTIVERRGPNAITIDGDKVWEREVWTIDGLGRTLEHFISQDDEEMGYVLSLVDKYEYHDRSFVDNEEPVHVREEHLRDFEENAWITSEQTFDGLGRILTETQVLEQGQQSISFYEYDGLGNLAAIEVPNPSTEEGLSHVRYEQSYDGLGRMTRLTRPNDTGLDIEYAGLERTIREVTGDNSGSIRKERRDVFGRLVEVQEIDPDAETAITLYRYDVQDNVREIVNADGDTTTLRHDWLSNRTAISRGDRTWSYEYDLNGNLEREIAPVPEGESSLGQITEYTYDDLDRVTTLGFFDNETSPTIQYTYDQGRNGVGRLVHVELPIIGEVDYSYNARGLVAAEERSFILDETVSVSDTQRVEREYNALGLPTLSTWDDGQQWQVTYDVRGLVDRVEWLDPETGAFRPVADYTRSFAGLPLARNSDYDQVREYGYDELGRPRNDTVFVGDNTIATRSYDFNDSGDLTSVTGETDGVSAVASYTYDAHHRLISATGPNGYEGTFTYSPAGNIRTADVSWNGSEATRNVRYEYGAVDPQAVDRLVNIDDGEFYADFTYDLSGNMIERNSPEGTMRLRWNGLDQLRKVEGTNGDEVYYYNHDGQRMLAVSDSEVRFWFDESETHYDLDGQQTQRLLHLSGAGPTLARVENGTDIELQYSDALQNLMFALDESGNVTASFLYGPFGEVLQSTGAEDHRRQFNGKENDNVSGLRYYGFRYYDPLTLRWNSADPLYRFVPDLSLGSPQRMNLYTFSLNNSMRYYDPDGRDANTANMRDSRFEPPVGPCFMAQDRASCWIDIAAKKFDARTLGRSEQDSEEVLIELQQAEFQGSGDTSCDPTDASCPEEGQPKDQDPQVIILQLIQEFNPDSPETPNNPIKSSPQYRSAKIAGRIKDILSGGAALAELSGYSDYSLKEAFKEGPGPFTVVIAYQATKGAEITGEGIASGAEAIWKSFSSFLKTKVRGSYVPNPPDIETPSSFPPSGEILY